MKTVLIADDNEGNREILRVVLETAGYRVVEAASGQEAVDVAQRESPELVVLDIQMPGMDGYDAMRTLRRDSRFSATPSIAVTAYAMQGDKEKAQAAGFHHHVSKPIDIGAFRRLIAEIAK